MLQAAWPLSLLQLWQLCALAHHAASYPDRREGPVRDVSEQMVQQGAPTIAQVRSTAWRMAAHCGLQGPIVRFESPSLALGRYLTFGFQCAVLPLQGVKLALKGFVSLFGFLKIARLRKKGPAQGGKLRKKVGGLHQSFNNPSVGLLPSST